MIATVRGLLGAEAGVSLAALCTATGWQAHSLRALLSTLRKSGCSIVREAWPGDGGAVYRLVEVPKPGSVDEDRPGAEPPGAKLAGADPGLEPSAGPAPAKRRARHKEAGCPDGADPAVHPMPAEPEPRPKTAGRKGKR